MKKLFAIVFLYILTAFYAQVQASEMPEGYLLQINSIHFKDFWLAFGTKDTQLVVTPKRIQDGSAYKLERSYMSIFEDIVQNEEEAHTLKDEYIFLEEGTDYQEKFFLHFELDNIVGADFDVVIPKPAPGSECEKVELNLIARDRVYATINYTITEALVEEISPDQYEGYENQKVLLRFNELRTNYKNGSPTYFSVDIDREPASFFQPIGAGKITIGPFNKSENGIGKITRQLFDDGTIISNIGLNLIVRLQKKYLSRLSYNYTANDPNFINKGIIHPYNVNSDTLTDVKLNPKSVGYNENRAMYDISIYAISPCW